MESGQLQWSFAEDEIYFMHTYARITEMRVTAHVAYYLYQYPFAAHLPIESVVSTFKHGLDDKLLSDGHHQASDVVVAAAFKKLLVSRMPRTRKFGVRFRKSKPVFCHLHRAKMAS